jgi:hypothetical protein
MAVRQNRRSNALTPLAARAYAFFIKPDCVTVTFEGFFHQQDQVLGHIEVFVAIATVCVAKEDRLRFDSAGWRVEGELALVAVMATSALAKR